MIEESIYTITVVNHQLKEVTHFFTDYEEWSKALNDLMLPEDGEPVWWMFIDSTGQEVNYRAKEVFGVKTTGKAPANWGEEYYPLPTPHENEEAE